MQLDSAGLMRYIIKVNLGERPKAEERAKTTERPNIPERASTGEGPNLAERSIRLERGGVLLFRARHKPQASGGWPLDTR